MLRDGTPEQGAQESLVLPHALDVELGPLTVERRLRHVARFRELGGSVSPSASIRGMKCTAGISVAGRRRRAAVRARFQGFPAPRWQPVICVFPGVFIARPHSIELGFLSCSWRVRHGRRQAHPPAGRIANGADGVMRPDNTSLLMDPLRSARAAAEADQDSALTPL